MFYDFISVHVFVLFSLLLYRYMKVEWRIDYTLKKYSSIMYRGPDLHFSHHDINTGGRDEPPFKGGWLLVSVPNCDYFLVTYRFKIEDKWHIQFRSVHNCRCT